MEKRNNTGLVVLVIILFLALVGTTGYIVYDKVLSKDGNVTALDNKTKTSNNEVDEKYDEVESYDILVNNSTHKITYKYYTEEVGDTSDNHYIKQLVDVYFNDTFVNTNYIIGNEKLSANNVKKIKGTDNREYLILMINIKMNVEDNGAIVPLIINDKGKVLYNFDKIVATCGTIWKVNDDKYIENGVYREYYIDTDKIYFVDRETMTKDKETGNDMANENVLTINNDTIKIETLGRVNINGVGCK